MDIILKTVSGALELSIDGFELLRNRTNAVDCSDILFTNFTENWIFYIFSILLGLGLWIIFFYPFSIMKDLTDVGFHQETEKNRSKNFQKTLVARARRLRSIGDRIPSPFPNGWFCLMESSQLKTGEATSINCIGKNFAVFRSEEGLVHVIDAYCPHMGANLGVGGTVRGDCIECPFHRWAIRGTDGECVNIPYSKSPLPKLPKTKTYLSKETNGWIFVWNHAENEDPWEIPVIDEIESGKWTFQGRNEYYVSCHIQEIPENGADVSHLNAVHGPSIVSGVDLRTTRSIWSSFIQHIWHAAWQPSETHPHIADVALKHSIRLFNKTEVCELNITTKQIGPGYVQLLFSTNYGRLVCLQTVTPVEPLVQKVVHRFYSPWYLAPFAKFILLGECIQFERDIMVWNSKKFVDNPILIKEDRQVKAYRTWFSQFYSENSIPFKVAKNNNLDW